MTDENGSIHFGRIYDKRSPSPKSNVQGEAFGARLNSQPICSVVSQLQLVLRDPTQLPNLGAEGLIDRLPGARGPHPNRISDEVEATILAHALHHPTHGALRVAQELSLHGVQVSSGGVRGVWSRHKLLTKQDRLRRLEKTTCEPHTHTANTCDLVAIDTFFVGHLKGVGKIYLQTAVDCRSRHAGPAVTKNRSMWLVGQNCLIEPTSTNRQFVLQVVSIG